MPSEPDKPPREAKLSLPKSKKKPAKKKKK